MKKVHKIFLEDLENSLKIFKTNKWNIKERALDFINKTTGHFNQTVQTNFDLKCVNTEWFYVKRFEEFFSKAINNSFNFHWASENIGSLLIKNLNNLMNIASCGPIKKEFLDQIYKIFTFPDQSVSLPVISYIYSLTDFKSLIDIHSQFISSGIKESFMKCFTTVVKNASNTKEYEHKQMSFAQILEPLNKLQTSPCMNPDQFPQCMEYCTWHKNLFHDLKKSDFLTIMRYGLPQRKMALNPILPNEKEIAAKLFGTNVIKDLNFNIAPMTLPIFCHRKDKGFFGDDLGISAKFCDDFFPTPTDIGICLSRNLNIKEIIHPNNEYEPLFESNLRQTNQRMEGDTLLTETTLVLYTDATNSLQQSAPRKLKTNLDKVLFQIHSPKNFAKLLLEKNYKKQLASIELQANHEYYIDVTPTGQISSNGFKTLDSKRRQCHLEGQEFQSPIFKLYSKDNCKYDCFVKKAKELCQCVPWDFIDGGSGTGECDVFGRTCFYEAIENITSFDNNQCNYCINNCDYINFEKLITKDEILSKITKESLAQKTTIEGKYIKYVKAKLTFGFVYKDFEDEIKSDRILIDFLRDNNNSLTDTGTVATFDSMFEYNKSPVEKYARKRRDMFLDMIIIHLRFLNPEIDKIDVKYTWLDKFAGFGGKFGIFAQLTGCSLLGILNIVLLTFKVLLAQALNRSS